MAYNFKGSKFQISYLLFTDDLISVAKADQKIAPP